MEKKHVNVYPALTVENDLMCEALSNSKQTVVLKGMLSLWRVEINLLVNMQHDLGLTFETVRIITRFHTDTICHLSPFFRYASLRRMFLDLCL